MPPRVGAVAVLGLHTASLALCVLLSLVASVHSNAAVACPATASGTVDAATTPGAWVPDMKAYTLTTGQTLDFSPEEPPTLDVSRGFTAVVLARPDSVTWDIPGTGAILTSAEYTQIITGFGGTLTNTNWEDAGNLNAFWGDGNTANVQFTVPQGYNRVIVTFSKAQHAWCGLITCDGAALYHGSTLIATNTDPANPTVSEVIVAPGDTLKIQETQDVISNVMKFVFSSSTGDLVMLKDANTNTIARLGATSGAVEAECPGGVGTVDPAKGAKLHAQAEGLGVYALVVSDDPTNAKVYAPDASGNFLHAGAGVSGCGGFKHAGVVADFTFNLAQDCSGATGACAASDNSPWRNIDVVTDNTDPLFTRDSHWWVANTLENTVPVADTYIFLQIDLESSREVVRVQIFFRVEDSAGNPLANRNTDYEIWIGNTAGQASLPNKKCYQHDGEPGFNELVWCVGSGRYLFLKFFNDNPSVGEVKIYGPDAAASTPTPGQLTSGYSLTLGGPDTGSAFAGLLGEAFVAPRALSRAELGLAIHGLAAYAGVAPNGTLDRWYTFDGDLASYHDRAARRRAAAEHEAAVLVDSTHLEQGVAATDSAALTLTGSGSAEPESAWVFTPAPDRRLYALEVAAAQTLVAPVAGTFNWAGDWTVAAWLRAGAGAGASGAVLSVVHGGASPNVAPMFPTSYNWQGTEYNGISLLCDAANADQSTGECTAAGCAKFARGTAGIKYDGCREDPDNNCKASIWGTNDLIYGCWYGSTDANFNYHAGTVTTYTGMTHIKCCTFTCVVNGVVDDSITSAAECTSGWGTGTPAWTHVALTHAATDTDILLHVNGGAGASTGINPSAWAAGGSVQITGAAIDDLRVYARKVTDVRDAGAPEPVLCHIDERPYPPVHTFDANTYNVDGSTDYGKGTYIVTTSSVNSANDQGYEMFDGVLSTTANPSSDGFISAHNYNYGVYKSSATNYIVSGYNGEWLKLQLPYAVVLAKYRFEMYIYGSDRGPGQYKIYGSNDDSGWTELVHKSETVSYSTQSDGSKYFEESISNANAYKYYALVANRLKGSDPLLHITELILYGSMQCLGAPYGNCDPDDADAASCAALLPVIHGDTGGWRLVRHILATGNWFSGNDDLAGTIIPSPQITYAAAQASGTDTEWTKGFGAFDQMMIATADMNHWFAWNWGSGLTGGVHVTLTTFAKSDSSTDIKYYYRNTAGLGGVVASDPHFYWDGEWASGFYMEDNSNHPRKYTNMGINVFVRDSTAAGGGGA